MITGHAKDGRNILYWKRSTEPAHQWGHLRRWTGRGGSPLPASAHLHLSCLLLFSGLKKLESGKGNVGEKSRLDSLVCSCSLHNPYFIHSSLPLQIHWMRPVDGAPIDKEVVCGLVWFYGLDGDSSIWCATLDWLWLNINANYRCFSTEATTKTDSNNVCRCGLFYDATLESLLFETNLLLKSMMHIYTINKCPQGFQIRWHLSQRSISRNGSQISNHINFKKKYCNSRLHVCIFAYTSCAAIQLSSSDLLSHV